MNRKKFLKKTILAGVTAAIAPTTMVKASNVRVKNSDYDKLMEPIGFNHLPNKEEKTMNTVLHKADTRGYANHGWLEARHSFSFANFHNAERMHFGVVRVLNDDRIAGSKGFGTHPHDNMEIITIPLEGALAHKDSMGNAAVIQEGEVQVMSAGTGIFHSEFNHHSDKDVKLFQIWLFPREKDVTPRYDQISIRDVEKANEFYQILSPSPDDAGVWIHQDAWFHLGKFEEGKTDTYQIKKKDNGLYVMVIEGDVTVNGQKLSARDGFGIWDIEQIDFKADSKARVLLMDVPMEF